MNETNYTNFFMDKTLQQTVNEIIDIRNSVSHKVKIEIKKMELLLKTWDIKDTINIFPDGRTSLFWCPHRKRLMYSVCNEKNICLPVIEWPSFERNMLYKDERFTEFFITVLEHLKNCNDIKPVENCENEE